MKTTLLSLTLLLTAPAFGQAVYKCPDASGVVRFQQMPCEGGKAIAVKPIPTGAGSGLSDEGRAYLQARDQARAEQAKAAEEDARHEAMWNAEHRKATAAEEQAAAQREAAAAQRETARAIRMTAGYRYRW